MNKHPYTSLMYLDVMYVGVGCWVPKAWLGIDCKLSIFAIERNFLCLRLSLCTFMYEYIVYCMYA